MNLNNSDAHKLLEARLDDMLERSRRGELVCGNFLTPAELSVCRIMLRQRGEEGDSFFWGGYNGAERQRLYVLPSYLRGIDGDSEERLKLYCDEEFSSSVKALSVKGSGYKKLTHRDYMGSVLALGVERHTIGDIVVDDDYGAVIFCTDKIADYLVTSLERIGSDKVTVKIAELSPDFCPEKKFIPVNDTVASNRLDCVVGALTSLSREKAQTLIRSGLCEIDHLPEDRCDLDLKVPCTISVRGWGKYEVVAFDGETRRGRLRLVAKKYI